MSGRWVGWGVVAVGLVVTLVALPNFAGASPVRIYHPPYSNFVLSTSNYSSNGTWWQAPSNTGYRNGGSISLATGVVNMSAFQWLSYGPNLSSLTGPDTRGIKMKQTGLIGFGVDPVIKTAGLYNFTFTWVISYDAALRSNFTGGSGAQIWEQMQIYSFLNIWPQNGSCCWSATHFLLKWSVGATNPNATRSANVSNLKVVWRALNVNMPTGTWHVNMELWTLEYLHIGWRDGLGPSGRVYMSLNETAALTSLKIST